MIHIKGFGKNEEFQPVDQLECQHLVLYLSQSMPNEYCHTEPMSIADTAPVIVRSIPSIFFDHKNVSGCADSFERNYSAAASTHHSWTAI